MRNILATITILAMGAYCHHLEKQIPLADFTRTRKAPMRYCDNLADGFSVAPETFIVYLRPGHSFKHHSHAVGRDMTPYVEHSFDQLYPEKVVYNCVNVNDDLLDAIRNDPGVDWVGCRHTPGAIPA
ncbi:hypothetical protein K505DRAFT_341860 [Melanomma pulvis-pyrius CBS 109.77]|uniref:Uncharacterized protein n=1 Tax=Melanomma pulvis-pyrius CBS 109.77 TaxID=1314802 RepID=A0A6A6WYB6_9PLEO|nr:hypothetical protein K505DRAFT_341860 [Melanomma pulvis-pyrius CBS 109.77]